MQVAFAGSRTAQNFNPKNHSGSSREVGETILGLSRQQQSNRLTAKLPASSAMRATRPVGFDSPVRFEGPDVRQYREVKVNGTGPWYPRLNLDDGMAYFDLFWHLHFP